ncbi:hypothetical protein [Dactylosporangium sp. NPDC005555]|uniref:hypothetical protein n=1 Tax=Dactylosporangium sp. NPDC005555 TaxID=3154889 RepID=UPI0033A4CFFC
MSESTHPPDGTGAAPEPDAIQSAAAPQPDGIESAALPEPDVIESPQPPRSRRLAVVLSTAAVVLVVLLGGGAFALARMWNGPTGTLPEDLVPGSVAAFARVDLSPGIGQRLKVEALLRKAGGSGPKTLDATKRDIFADLDAPIGYEDVAGWFDDRIGIAEWADPGRDGRGVTLVAVSSRDDDKARKALTAAQQKAGTDRLGFVAGDGHVLLAFGGKDLQRAATDAAAAAKKAPLSKEPAFTAAVAKLPSGQPGLAWADLARATDLQQAFFGYDLEDGEEDVAGPPIALPELKGTLVAGVQAGDDGLEVRARVTGGSGLPLTGGTGAADALALLSALPAGATAAGAGAGPLGDLSLFGSGGHLLSSVLFPATLFAGLGDLDPDSLPPPPGVDPGLVVTLPPGLDPSDPESVQRYLEQHPELLDRPGGAVLTFERRGGLDPQEVGKANDALGKALAAATSVTFAVAGPQGKPEDQGRPGELSSPLQVDLRLADAAAAKQLQADLAELLKVGGTVCEVRDDHVILRTKTFAAGAGGTLADDAGFRAATAGGIPAATAAFYVGGGDIAPAKAIGVTVGRDGADTVVMARILIG